MIPSRTLGGCCVIRASLHNAAFALLAILCGESFNKIMGNRSAKVSLFPVACLIYYVVHLEYLLSQSRRKCPCLSDEDEDSFQPRPLFNYFSPASVPDTTTTFPTTERTVEGNKIISLKTLLLRNNDSPLFFHLLTDVSSRDKKAPPEKAHPDTCGDDIPLDKQVISTSSF